MTAPPLALPRTGSARVVLPAPARVPRHTGFSVRRRWRRSLQLRVVVTTLLASGIVVGLLASLLLDQVGRGLVEAKTRASVSEAQAGVESLQTAMDRLNRDAEPRTVIDGTLAPKMQELASRGAADDLYSVVAISSERNQVDAGSARLPGFVPPGLATQLAEDPGPLYAYAPVPDRTGQPVPGLVTGSVVRTPLAGLTYSVYHLFPLTSEAATLGLVQRTAGAAGVLLVALLALIAGLVARQAVTPVRQAAGTAGELAAGRLDVRMQVRGEDELARLALTFNAMADALQSQIRQLEDLAGVQRRFVSDVSHELRTPLTTVRMAADVLHDARADFAAAPARSAELLQAELERFEALLAELLEISRYDAGAMPLAAEPVDVAVLVDRVLEQTAALAGRQGSRLRVRSVGGPAVAEVDHVRVERVLRNLVVNALEHGEGRPVELTVGAGEQVVQVLVRDYGIGLRPGDAEQVFGRFWRADPSRARTSGGTGLGLAIALEDARRHGGRLEAWGRPGQGAAFRLTLPRQAGGSTELPGPLGLPDEVPA